MNETTPVDRRDPHGRPPPDSPRRCRAKSKQSQERCKRWASPGSGLCIIHGGRGNTPGPSHQNYKHGRYSKALKGLGDLKVKYERARKDPELNSSADEIAVIVGLMEQTLESTGRDGNPRAALELQESLQIIASDFDHVADVFTAHGSGSKQLTDAAERCRELGRNGGEMGRAQQLVTDLIGYRAAIEHWRGLAEQASRTREREAKRITALAAVVTMDQYNFIMAMIGETLMRHCPREIVNAIHRDLSVALAGVADAPLAVGAAYASGDPFNYP
jgi:hypothetical protein